MRLNEELVESDREKTLVAQSMGKRSWGELVNEVKNKGVWVGKAHVLDESGVSFKVSRTPLK